MSNTSSFQATPYIGVAAGLAAGDADCSLGPAAFKKYLEQTASIPSQFMLWQESPLPQKWLTKLDFVHQTNLALAHITHDLAAKKEFFHVIGGDHSCAMGTWSGAAAAVNGPIGLLWVDAHLDCHTPETSHSGNIHGMPLATLLGHGASVLTEILLAKPKFLPQNVCVVGARSFEPEELKLIKSLGARVFYMPEIRKLGLPEVMRQALNIVSEKTDRFGFSIDLDAFDPKVAPGVGTPEVKGICDVDGFLAELVKCDLSRLIGVEITEYNPVRDHDQSTAALMAKICQAFRTKIL